MSAGGIIFLTPLNYLRSSRLIQAPQTMIKRTFDCASHDLPCRIAFQRVGKFHLKPWQVIDVSPNLPIRNVNKTINHNGTKRLSVRTRAPVATAADARLANVEVRGRINPGKAIPNFLMRLHSHTNKISEAGQRTFLT